MDQSPSLLLLGFGTVVAVAIWLKHMQRTKFNMLTLEEGPRAGEIGVLSSLK